MLPGGPEFFHWRVPMGRRIFPLKRSLMTDPTELVLTCGFAVALGVFVISSLVRIVSAGKQWPVLTTNPVVLEESDPYQSPEQPSMPPELPVGRVPVWFYRPTDLAGAGFVFLVFSGLFLASVASPRDAEAVLNPRVLVVNIGFQFVIAGLVAILASRRVTPGMWLGLRWPAWRWVFLIAPGAVAFMWLVFGGLQISGYVKWMESLGVETVQETVKLLQKSEDPLILGLMAFAAVAAAPLCEEIVFRGYFYPVLKKHAGAWPAAFCSALVFASAHGNLTALLPLFIFGCLLVFIYEKTGSIWAPIAVHCCFNSATVIAQFAARHLDLPLQPAP
jgi:membrane protease YdiL (CAAX protease family)